MKECSGRRRVNERIASSIHPLPSRPPIYSLYQVLLMILPGVATSESVSSQPRAKIET